MAVPWLKRFVVGFVLGVVEASSSGQEVVLDSPVRPWYRPGIARDEAALDHPQTLDT